MNFKKGWMLVTWDHVVGCFIILASSTLCKRVSYKNLNENVNINTDLKKQNRVSYSLFDNIIILLKDCSFSN